MATSSGSVSASRPRQDVLAGLTAEELADAVQREVEARVGSSGGARMRVYVSALLHEGEQVDRLAGSPYDVIERLNTERQHQLVVRSAAHRAVLDEPLLESTAVADALGHSGSNGREAASKHRLAGRLVGIKQGNRYLYPAFQFDFALKRISPVVAAVNQELDAAQDPWGVASWWISGTPRLGGRAPRELIGAADEDDLLLLAHAESEE